MTDFIIERNEIIQNINNEFVGKIIPTSYSFACGGWLKMYLFGVGKFLSDKKLAINARFIGSSAGALTGTALALDLDFNLFRDHVINDLLPQAHENFFGAFKVRDYLLQALEKLGQLDNYNKLNVSQRSTIVFTSLSNCTSRRINTFKDKESLITALLASCCATPIAGLPFKRENEWVFDGGLMSFQPIFDKETITINPFYCTTADIRPSKYVPMWWALYPPCEKNLKWLYALGYEDAWNWAYNNKYINNKIPENKKADKIINDNENKNIVWKTKLGRFIGYASLENRILDLFFIGLVILIWKPLAFILMYTELICKVIISGGTAFVFGAAWKFIITFIISGIISSILVAMSCGNLIVVFGLFLILISLCGLLTIAVGGTKEAKKHAIKDLQTCLTCLRSIVSLSLLLRSLPLIGPSVPIKRHTFLLEHSVIYRLTNHFV